MISVSGTVAWRAIRWVPALGFGALWWWGVLRLAFAPDAGALEGAVAAGGWGLSMLPVHCVPEGQAVGARAWRRRRERGLGGSGGPDSPGGGSPRRESSRHEPRHEPRHGSPRDGSPRHGDAAIGAEDLAGREG
ncbi:hypothetical protein DCW30_28335 [Streptomyces alfalfae]|nr:hypothetical protein D3X13_09415 [Streptomyces fradiae]RXX38398.1 hypothetical protein DCW30_28335 [Streptomyces alfalfae]RZM98436.1 hypothetical protein D4104_12290 [Streptomyces alfalfae]